MAFLYEEGDLVNESAQKPSRTSGVATWELRSCYREVVFVVRFNHGADDTHPE